MKIVHILINSTACK